MKLTRRRLVAAIGSTGLGALAGCQQPEPVPTTETEPPTRPRTTEPATATPTTERSPTESPPAPEGATTFLSAAQITRVTDKVAEREQPWWGGYRRLLDDAQGTLGVTPMSVVEDGAPANGADENYFGTDCRKGDCASRHDYMAALRMSRWTRTLAQAYRFSGRDVFGRGAIELLHHWFVAPATRMAPSGNNHGESPFAIQLHVTIPAMIYASSLVEAHPSWDDDRHRAVREWVRAYLTDLEDGADVNDYRGTIENNIYAWWLVARGTAATYLADSQAFDRVVDDWKSNALGQVQADGGLEYEKQREDGLFYSIYGMKALFMTAELARQHDEDLYGYPTGEDPVLRRLSDYHAPYVLEPSTWEWGLGEEGRLSDAELEEAASVYELAYSEWQDEAHRRVIQTAGRPVYDRRLLGWVSLTHGNRFELDL
jgi:hypothetical protein